jgi:hypothetical protein
VLDDEDEDELSLDDVDEDEPFEAAEDEPFDELLLPLLDDLLDDEELSELEPLRA